MKIKLKKPKKKLRVKLKKKKELSVCERMIIDINNFGKNVRGRNELLNHLQGNKISRVQAVKAKCYDCMGYFPDGREDCKSDLCPLYEWRPCVRKNKND